MARLDSQLDGLRGRELPTKPLPNIQSVNSLVCAEANCQGAMLGGMTLEGTAMVTRKTSTSKKHKKCTHCNGTRHTLNTCFLLHGYPDWHPKSKKVSHISSNTKDENTSLKVNLSTTFGFAAKSSTSLIRNSDWIIDTGANDHMTCDRHKFDQLSSKCPINIVTNDNGVSYPKTTCGFDITGFCYWHMFYMLGFIRGRRSKRHHFSQRHLKTNICNTDRVTLLVLDEPYPSTYLLLSY